VRVVEHRRHSRRDPGGVHLNPEGLEIARRVAPMIGRFDRVVTSPIPRAVETAEALGFSIDLVLPELALIPDPVQKIVDTFPPRSFADCIQLARRRPAVAEYARRQAALMHDELARVPDGGRLLMISHGGIIEFGAAGARPHDALGFGETAGYLEGVRLTMDAGAWVGAEVLRVPPSGPAPGPTKGRAGSAR
jgi:broad specificity phosphatase PhoE